MDIVIDFDGTVVSHEYPKVGNDIGSIPILKRLVERDHRLILFTMRSGLTLNEAVNWFKQNDIPLYGIQQNPSQVNWTNSPKAYGELYIDDCGIGCPLKHDISISKRPFVNWNEIEEMLIIMGILHQ